MPNGIISAPTSIAPMVMDLKKASEEIDRLMGELELAKKKLMGGSSGAAVEAFDQAGLVWKNRGMGESGRTVQVAMKSDEYAQNMNHVDRRAAGDFMA